MRISDWSSDVCSSDLLIRRLGGRKRAHAQKLLAVGVAGADQRLIQNIDLGQGIGRLVDALNGGIKRASDKGQPADAAFGEVFAKRLDGARSEEHTSELQSLMRISYAVFCLKKKNKHRRSADHHPA